VAEELERMKTLLEQKEAELAEEEEKTANMRKIYEDNLLRLATVRGRLEAKKRLNEADVQKMKADVGRHLIKDEDEFIIEGKTKQKLEIKLGEEDNRRESQESIEDNITATKEGKGPEIKCEALKKLERKELAWLESRNTEVVGELQAVEGGGSPGGAARPNPRIVDIGSEDEEGTDDVIKGAKHVAVERHEGAPVTPPASQLCTKSPLQDLTTPPPPRPPHLLPLYGRPSPTTPPLNMFPFHPLLRIPPPLVLPSTSQVVTTMAPLSQEAPCGSLVEVEASQAPPADLLREWVRSCSPNYYRGHFSLTEADLVSVTFKGEWPCHRNYARELSAFLQLHQVTCDANNDLLVTFRNQAELYRACRGCFAASCDTLEKVVQSRRGCSMERVASRWDGSEAYILTLTEETRLERRHFAKWEGAEGGLVVTKRGLLVGSKVLLVTILRDAEVRASYPSIQLHSSMFHFLKDSTKDKGSNKFTDQEEQEKKSREVQEENCLTKDSEKEVVRSVVDDIVKQSLKVVNNEEKQEESELEEKQKEFSEHKKEQKRASEELVSEHNKKQEEVSGHEEKQEGWDKQKDVSKKEGKYKKKQDDVLDYKEKDGQLFAESLVEEILEICIENLFQNEEKEECILALDCTELIMLNVEEMSDKEGKEGGKAEGKRREESAEEVEVLVEPQKVKKVEESEERFQESKAVVEGIVGEVLDNSKVKAAEKPKTKKGKKRDKNNNKKRKSKILL